MSKVCTKCGVEKSRELFSRGSSHWDGLQSHCKVCDAAYNAARYVANPEKFLARGAAYYAANPEKHRVRCRANSTTYRAKNPEKVGAHNEAYKAARRKADPGFRLLESLRKRLCKVMRGESKSSPTKELVGCSIGYLRDWLAWQFQPGMGWHNYGQWHIDHIRPCASFDLTDPAQQRECFHFQNLQPLWAKDNIRKGTKCPTTPN
jgi:hypothetical protein